MLARAVRGSVGVRAVSSVHATLFRRHTLSAGMSLKVLWLLPFSLIFLVYPSANRLPNGGIDGVRFGISIAFFLVMYATCAMRTIVVFNL